MVCAIGDVAGPAAILFAVVDDHVHVVLVGELAQLIRVKTGLSRAFNARSVVRFDPPFVREVTTRAHLLSLVRYCLTQAEHHGIAGHPAVATGSCFADLVGARRVPGLSLPLSAVLPRLQRRELYEAVGFAGEIAPASPDALARLGAEGLCELVAATMCLPPGLRGNTGRVADARRLVARLAAAAGMRPTEAARALEITPTAAARLGERPVEAGLEQAAHQRLALELAVRARGSGVAGPRPPATLAPAAP